ncbi:MAG: hypothetical protein ACRD5G_00750 [Candidatus Acidiferrales bacterium]
MNRSGKTLILGGLLLVIWGMSYGLWYALFDEHQTLVRMGERLTTAYAQAAARDLPAANAALDLYAATKFEYVREVDVHSHWSGLAVLLFVLGLMFEQVNFTERHRRRLAWALVAGSFLFPLGVILQTVWQGLIPQGIAAVASGLLILALGAVAWGFSRR